MFHLIPNKLLYVFLLAALALMLAVPAANANNSSTVGPVKKRTLATHTHTNTARTLYALQGTCFKCGTNRTPGPHGSNA